MLATAPALADLRALPSTPIYLEVYVDLLHRGESGVLRLAYLVVSVCYLGSENDIALCLITPAAGGIMSRLLYSTYILSTRRILSLFRNSR